MVASSESSSTILLEEGVFVLVEVLNAMTRSMRTAAAAAAHEDGEAAARLRQHLNRQVPLHACNCV
jgi:hypothetical protein